MALTGDGRTSHRFLVLRFLVLGPFLVRGSEFPGGSRFASLGAVDPEPGTL